MTQGFILTILKTFPISLAFQKGLVIFAKLYMSWIDPFEKFSSSKETKKCTPYHTIKDQIFFVIPWKEKRDNLTQIKQRLSLRP